MTEKQLIKLGFEKQIEEDEETPFYYYTLDISEGLTFITDANDEIEYNNWNVEIFNTSHRFTNYKTLSTLIDILNSNKDED